MRHPVAVEQPLPLTLTLSLRERGQQPTAVLLEQSGWANSVSVSSRDSGGRLPLPKGEGRGEGEQSVVDPTVSFVTVQRFNGSTVQRFKRQHR